MSLTEIDLSKNAKDATLTPAKVSTNPADNFTFPGDILTSNGDISNPAYSFTLEPQTGLWLNPGSSGLNLQGQSAAVGTYIKIKAGDSLISNGGNVIVNGGGTTDGGSTGGAIILQPGSGPAGNGNGSLNAGDGTASVTWSDR